MTISATAKAAMLSQNSGDALIYLLVITSNMVGAETLYLCSNPWADITSGGQLYQKFYFDVILLGQSDDVIPEVTITIDNVDRSIVNFVRTQTVPATITLSAVLASTPNTVEMGPLTMKLRDTATANWSPSARQAYWTSKRFSRCRNCAAWRANRTGG